MAAGLESGLGEWCEDLRDSVGMIDLADWLGGRSLSKGATPASAPGIEALQHQPHP